MTDIINKEKILEHAKKLVAEGKFDKAVAEYEKILQLDSEDLRVKIKIAELYVKRKQIQSAIKLYMEVAKGYADGSFYLKAVTVYKSILRLNPSLIDVNIALSELYEKMELIQDALYQYQIVSTALEQKNDSQGVLNVREKMVALDPANVSLRIRLAETYQLQGVVDKSIDMYEALAVQQKNSADTEQLIELYSKILAHRPEKHDFVRHLCQIYFKRGDLKEILKRMDAAKDFVAKDAEMLSMQADIFARLNQIESAKHKYQELAELHASEGNIDKALLTYGNVLFLSPEEEEEVSKKVEDLREGSFADVKSYVEERRKKIADEDVKREVELKKVEEAAVKTEEMAKKLGVKPKEVSLSQDEAKKVEKEASANCDLGQMYKKMGLADEARAEFLKAFKNYQRLAAGNAGGGLVAERIRELEKLFDKEPTISKDEDSKPVEPPKKPVKPAAPSSKKKISFV
jgi:tetratricopeptide (TPR) repeat protein